MGRTGDELIEVSGEKVIWGAIDGVGTVKLLFKLSEGVSSLS